MGKSTGRIGVATGAGIRAAQQDHKYRTHIEHRRAWSTAMVVTYYARTISLSRKTGIFLTRTFVLQPVFNFLTRRLLQLLLLAQRIGQYSAGCSTWWLGRGILWVGSTNGMKSCTIKMWNCCHHHNITEWKCVRKNTRSHTQWKCSLVMVLLHFVRRKAMRIFFFNFFPMFVSPFLPPVGYGHASTKSKSRIGECLGRCVCGGRIFF